MMVMDEDNHGHDAIDVSPEDQDEAERKIDEWAGEYRLDVRKAKGELRRLVREM
jgi:hypothetical protein